MVKTEDRVELLTEMFHKELEFNKLYSRTEIEELMDKRMDYYYNVTALTYNRWNKGMSYTCPLFEHTDRGTYRYLGSNYPYCGIVSHFPQGVSEEFIIGRWWEGELRFTNPNITTFKEWINSDYDGERISSMGSKVVVNRDGKQNFRFLLSETSGGLTDGFGHISIESGLGKNLRGKQVGENFEMGDVVYEIISIE